MTESSRLTVLEEAKITIILLNYQRPQNIPVILDSIKRQTIKATVFLWNNGNEDVNSPLIDRYVESTENVGCMVRWKLAREAKTPYVMSLDDDICFNRNDALQDIIESLEDQDNPNRIIGVAGACFGKIPYYTMQQNFECPLPNHLPDQDVAVDIVKGRVMAFRKALLDDVQFPDEREDDIFLSSTFADKARKFHRIPILLNDAFYDLPTFGRGNWLENQHFLSRDRALRKYFPSGGVLDNWFVRFCVLGPYRAKVFVLRKLGRLN